MHERALGCTRGHWIPVHSHDRSELKSIPVHSNDPSALSDIAVHYHDPSALSSITVHSHDLSALSDASALSSITVPLPLSLTLQCCGANTIGRKQGSLSQTVLPLSWRTHICCVGRHTKSTTASVFRTLPIAAAFTLQLPEALLSKHV